MAINKLNSTSKSNIQNPTSVEKSESTKAHPSEIKLGIGATADGFEDRQTASAALAKIKSQMGKVEVKIKEVMSSIENVQETEQQEQDRIKSSEEQQEEVQSDLQKAAEAYQKTLDSLMPKP